MHHDAVPLGLPKAERPVQNPGLTLDELFIVIAGGLLRYMDHDQVWPECADPLLRVLFNLRERLARDIPSGHVQLHAGVQ